MYGHVTDASGAFDMRLLLTAISIVHVRMIITAAMYVYGNLRTSLTYREATYRGFVRIEAASKCNIAVPR